MEQKLQIQRQKFGPDHRASAAKPRLLLSSCIPVKKYFCRIAQSLPDHRHTAGKTAGSEPQCRTVQLNRYRSLQP